MGWTCTHTHTKPGRILATRSTTSVGTWTTISVRCIANHSMWLCVVRNREGPFAVHIETKFPTPPSTAHIDQLYNSPFTHTHTHTHVPYRAVPCRAVLSPDNCILVRIVGGYLADYAVFFFFK